MTMLIMHCHLVNGQLKSIEIEIVDEYGEAVPGAHLELLELKQHLVADVDGKIVLHDLNQKSLTIEIHALGYKVYHQRMNVASSVGKKLVVQMQEDVRELGEVVIRSSKEELTGNKTFLPDVVGLKAIRATPQSIPRIIGRLPGIRIRQEGGLGSQSDIMLNGIGGKGIRVFIDDLPVYLMGAAYSINNISPGMIKRIEVYKGLIPVKFGSDALGGVINIVSRFGNTEFIDVGYSYGSWNTHKVSLNSQKFIGRSNRFFVSVDGFYNYSDNNYWMDDVEIVTDTVNYNTGTGRVRRFNDAFESVLGRVRIGVRNSWWADEFLVTSSYGHIYKEWQHGVYADQPWGEPYSNQDSWSSAAIWTKYGEKQKWDIKITAGYTHDKLHFVDTARKTYYWDQNYQSKITGGESAIYANGTTPELITQTYFGRESFNYHLNNRHKLNITLLITEDDLKGRNKAMSQENQAKFASTQTLLKNYTGVALESNLFNSSLTNVLAGKHFYSYSEGLDYQSSSAEFGDKIEISSSNFGYGDVLQYVWNTFTINVGYEFTVRQPDKDEIFGDYITIAPNAELKPERSNNINLGGIWESTNGRLSAGTSFFYRKTENKINLYAITYGLSYYMNLMGTETVGGNANVAYEFIKGFRVSGNATYQDITLAEVDPDGSLKASLIGARIPNVPYLFSNAQLSYNTDQFIKNGSLSFIYDYNYVHEFFLTWSENGKKSTKAVIPTQSLHNISLSWQSSNELWSVGFECRNILNTKVYDNFSVQKPGRSFFIKTRWFIDLNKNN